MKQNAADKHAFKEQSFQSFEFAHLRSGVALEEIVRDFQVHTRPAHLDVRGVVGKLLASCFSPCSLISHCMVAP